MTTVNRSQVATARDAGDELAVDRYSGAILCRHLNTWTQTLNRTRSTTPSQCSWLRRKWVSPRSNLRVFEMIRAAVPSWGHVATCRSSSSERQSGESHIWSINDLERPIFKVTPFFDADYIRNGTTYSFNEILIGIYTCRILNNFISNDLEWAWWLRKIFNDTERRAVSLRQLSFLYLRQRDCIRGFMTMRYINRLFTYLYPYLPWIRDWQYCRIHAWCNLHLSS